MYPDAIKDVICERIACGESLRHVCESDGMPNRETVSRWLEADPEYAARYARARETQADGIFESMADIESEVIGGTLKPDAARVVLESRRWRAEKLKPKAYGAKVDMQLSGSVKFQRIECVVIDPAG